MPNTPATPRFAVTNNVTRATFDFVAKHPGLTRTQIMQKMRDQGYKASSVTSLLGQLERVGQLRRDPASGGVFTVASQCAPIKVSKLKAKRVEAKARKPKKSAVVTVAPLEPVFHAAPAAPAAAEFDADTFIDTLTLRQARAVYEALRKVFGA